jgi:hypothetical protein
MSFRTTVVALLLLVCAGCSCESYSRSSTGFSNLDKKVLYDFRAREPRQANRQASNLEPSTGATIVGTYDLDGDGRNELLLEFISPGPGRQIKSARLVQYDKGQLITLEDFGQVYDNSCGAGEGTQTARTIYYLPSPRGQKPRFIVELYRAPCSPQGQQPQWTRVTGR